MGGGSDGGGWCGATGNLQTTVRPPSVERKDCSGDECTDQNQHREEGKRERR